MFQGVILVLNDGKGSGGSKNLVQLIKQCAIEAMIASKPCNTCIGKVTKMKPLTISVGQKMLLDSDFLDITSTANEKMKKGSRVFLIRQQGGQKYTIIDTLV